ncbi:MAG: HEPN domain-containing protein [Nitrospirae bacterium]|nr:HEPN domain-containing protein [Nitrospirota bacterium]
MKNGSKYQAWVSKAEADFKAAAKLVSLRQKGMPDIVCFHAQQCVEKYLKGFLTLHNIMFPKTHDLRELLDLASGIDPLVQVVRDAAIGLNVYAVTVRYPGDEATPAEARAAVKTMKKLRAFLRKKLGSRR